MVPATKMAHEVVNQLKLLVDGTEIPYSGDLAEAAIVYHRDRGDIVSDPDANNTVRISTGEGNSISLTEEFAMAVAGYPLDSWEPAAKQNLGRKFDPTLDLYCYRTEGRVSAEVYSGNHPVRDLWRMMSTQTVISSGEKLRVYHMGECKGSVEMIHRHDLDISVDITFWKPSGAALYWNSDLLKDTLHEMESRILARERSDDHRDEHPNGGEEIFLWITGNRKWHQFISTTIADRILKSLRSIDLVSVSVMENGSVLAYTEME